MAGCAAANEAPGAGSQGDNNELKSSSNPRRTALDISSRVGHSRVLAERWTSASTSKRSDVQWDQSISDCRAHTWREPSGRRIRGWPLAHGCPHVQVGNSAGDRAKQDRLAFPALRTTENTDGAALQETDTRGKRPLFLYFGSNAEGCTHPWHNMLTSMASTTAAKSRRKDSLPIQGILSRSARWRLQSQSG